MSLRTLVVVNPQSRGGATRREFGRIEPLLREALGPVEVEWTRGPRDAERIAREGVRSGVERIVVAAGDGTVSEVVTGLLAAELGEYAELALLPLGTGGDLPRTLGISRNPEVAVAGIREGKVRRLDAGRVRYCAPDGSQATAYFLNIASLGMSGLVTELVNRSSKRMGGRVAFLLGTLRGIARYSSPAVTLRLDGRQIHAGPLAVATAANGRYFGGGMAVAPEAQPDDGLFDVVVGPGLSRLQMLSELARIYRGTHIGAYGVEQHRGRRLEADAAVGEVWLEADGEPLGTLPACFELMPGAIRFLGCAS